MLSVEVQTRLVSLSTSNGGSLPGHWQKKKGEKGAAPIGLVHHRCGGEIRFLRAVMRRRSSPTRGLIHGVRSASRPRVARCVNVTRVAPVFVNTRRVCGVGQVGAALGPVRCIVRAA